MDSADKLRKLLNDEQLPPKEFTERNLRILTPMTDNGNGEWNTKLGLEGIPGRGYYGSDEVFYKRIPLDQIEWTTALRSDQPLTQQSIIDLLNKTMALWMTVDDVEPFTPPVLADGESATITLTAVPTSLGFIGSLDITIEYGRAWLDIAVATKSLRVQKHPIATIDYRKSARMLTWSKDFTSLRDSLAIVKSTYADFDKLVAAAATMGIPSWTQASAIDYATSAIPDANQDFDRVVIQRNVVSPGMLGDLYFHYNNLEEI